MKISFVLLLIATLIFAAASSVIAKLGLLGAHHLTDGRNPISFCNVLFTANIIAGFTLLAIHHRSWKGAREVKPAQWAIMTLIAVLSGVIAPTCFFLSLMLAPVINVVLVATIEIPLTLLAGYLFFREKPHWGSVIGALLALIGVAITFLLHMPNPMPMHMRMTMINIGTGPAAHFLATLPKAGEILAAVGTFFTVLAVALGRRTTHSVPIGIFSVFRMIVGAIIFFVVVLIMLGWVHFVDIFNPFLWEWMLFYGGVIIALGLYLWYKGAQGSNSADLAITSSLSPIFGIFFAYLILREIPEFGQYIGGGVIILGIFLALAVTLLRERAERLRAPRPQGFSGL